MVIIIIMIVIIIIWLSRFMPTDQVLNGWIF